MDRPIQLATKNKENKWQITEEAKQILEATDQKVVVIGIVGNYRTGKSYLLNRLVDTSSGFSVGSTVQAETKGIWMWVKSHPTQVDTKLVFLDTEGLNDIEKEEQASEDIELFCLVILLCSVVVFNVKGTLNGDFIQTLHLVSELSDNIAIGTDAGDDYLSEYFPKLVVLIRDLELELSINGQKVTPTDYFEHNLLLKPGSSKKTNAYNLPRECVRKFFPKRRRRCYTLPRPVAEDMRNLGKGGTQTTQNFEDDFNSFKGDLLELAEPMTFHENALTGRAYVDYADGLIASINRKELPNIESTISTIAMKDGQRALEKGIEEYQNQTADIESRMPLSEEDLDMFHHNLREKALSVFDVTISLKRKESYPTFCTQFQDKIQDFYDKLLIANLKKSDEVCKLEIKGVFENLVSKIDKGQFSCKGGCKLFIACRDEAVRVYESKENLGPEKTRCLDKYLEDLKQTERSIITADEALTKKEQEKQIEIENTKRADAQRKQAVKEKERLVEMAKNQESEHKEIMDKTKRQLNQEMEAKINESNRLLANKDSEIEKMREQGREVDRLKQERDKLESDRESLLTERRMRQRQYDQMVLEGEQNYQIMRGVGGLIGGLFSAALQ